MVERILAATQQALKDLMGNSSELRNLKASDFTDEKFAPMPAPYHAQWR